MEPISLGLAPTPWESVLGAATPTGPIFPICKWGSYVSPSGDHSAERMTGVSAQYWVPSPCSGSATCHGTDTSMLRETGLREGEGGESGVRPWVQGGQNGAMRRSQQLCWGEVSW